MEYELLVAGNYHELITVVNLRLQDGWRPQGGIAVDVRELPQNEVTNAETVIVYAQAMVRDAPGDDPDIFGRANEKYLDERGGRGTERFMRRTGFPDEG